MIDLAHSVRDAHVVEQQLGRPLQGRWAVAARCHLDLPTVIENHPLTDDGSPFPTLYWLTCPILVKWVSRVEGTGGMKDLNAVLEKDASLRARLGEAVARYSRTRDAHEVLSDVSIPGGGPERVKCLHAHVAHELAEPPNPAGALTLARTGYPDCVVPCIDVPR